MLICNYSYINQVLGRQFGGLTSPVKYFKPEVMLNFYTQDDITNISSIKKDSFPTGTQPPYSYVLGFSTGLMSATTTLYQSNSITLANLAGGLNGVSTLDGTSTLTGNLGALAFLISSIAGTSTLSADIQGSVDIAATLAGNGDLSGALSALVDIFATLDGNGDLTGSIAGALEASATLAGSGDLVGSIGGVVEILSTLTGTGDLTASIIGNWDMAVALSGSGTLLADIYSVADMVSALDGSGTIVLTSGAVPGDMECVITSCGDLSPESLAAAVWNSLAVAFNNPGTMGELLNNASAGGNPWAVTLEGTFTAQDMMKILVAVAAGQSEITDLGGGAATVVFRDLSDTLDRVSADMLNSERVGVGYDLS